MTDHIRATLLLVGFLAVLLAGCTPGGEIPVLGWYRSEDSLARVVLELARTRQCDSLLPLFDPGYVEQHGLDCGGTTPGSSSEPAPVPTRIRLVGYQAAPWAHKGPLGTTYVQATILTYEMAWPNLYQLIHITIAGEQDEPRIKFFGYRNTTVPVEQMNGIDFSVISSKHLIFVGLMLLSLLLGLYTFVLLLRSDDPKKWLWALLIPLGAGQFSLSWTTGDISWRIISFAYPSVSVGKQFAWESWILNLFLPIGAFICWFRYRESNEDNKSEGRIDGASNGAGQLPAAADTDAPSLRGAADVDVAGTVLQVEAVRNEVVGPESPSLRTD